MVEKCAVCHKEKRRDNMQYIEPIEDWVCQPCLKKGREEGVASIEEGRKTVAQIRGENLKK